MPRFSLLSVLTLLIALLVALPLAGLLLQALQPDDQAVWRHLADTVLADYAFNSLVLALGVGLGSALLGTGSAWLVSRYQFPGQRSLEWALLLPLAMPTYVIAYVYTDALQFSGPVQSSLRALFDWQRGDYWFFEIRSLAGLIVVFSLVFYPYVYVMVREAFHDRPASIEEVSRSLGLTRTQALWRVLLPMARPAIVAGVALVMMESLAEFGAVSYFGVNTLTTGIYKAWYSFGNPAAAAQLALSLVGLVMLALVLEKTSRGRARFHNQSGRKPKPQELTGWRGGLALSLCALPLLGGFVLPGAWLLVLALGEAGALLDARYLAFAGNSLMLATLASALALGVALLLGYATRIHNNRWLHGLKRFAIMGYAVPGTVLAVGVLIPLTALDHAWIAWAQSMFGVMPGLLLTGSMFALLFAYLVRFLAVAVHAVDSSLQRIRPSLDDAAQGLGLSRWQVLQRVHLPLLKGGMLSAVLLVFVEVMKELPATIVLRPFNLDTLATQVFVLASDERLAEAAVPSLMIVAVGLLPVLLLTRAMRRA
ncbi:MAG TPA: iron ABC transporter permease [bacterium]|nr:iron ABC transporter permease [bacterium]